MIDGEWTDISKMTDENGEFQRSETNFRDEIDGLQRVAEGSPENLRQGSIR